MKYSFETEIVVAADQQWLVCKLPDQIKVVEEFLGVEIQERGGAAEFFMEAIDKVLSGKDEAQYVSGNVIALDVMKDQTFVTEMLADDGIGNACYIETEELKKLILVWLDELEKFNQSQKD
ncbi:hypothetical protein OS242_21010 [Tumebacillus sp. DT12]|uniref:Uncharacterized protein n=1 Tax=Tumebacillus lacus TaxID=2995335 RepID=A0ABT3X8U5_9BACL|nr:hypothetical protein [Tumebacillus lacus]MCX7572393.1 hypothetical protein [Tumebacillus lacus]